MLEALGQEGVEFVVVGAFALAAHGVPRATGDIDIWVRPTPTNANRILAALASFGAPLMAHGISARDFETPDLVYQLGLPPHRIDLLTSVDGLRFEEAWARRTSATLFGLEVPILAREDLITNKRATARPRDLLDVELLERGQP